MEWSVSCSGTLIIALGTTDGIFSGRYFISKSCVTFGTVLGISGVKDRLGQLGVVVCVKVVEFI